METKTVSVYDGLAHVNQCFAALGEAGEALRDFGAVLREYVLTRQECNASDDRIQAIAAVAGLKAHRPAADRLTSFSRAIEEFRARGGRKCLTETTKS